MRSRTRLIWALLCCFGWVFVSAVIAQQPVDVQVLCTDDWISGYPPAFEGTIYRVRTPEEDYASYQLERITASVTEVLDMTIPVELYGRVFPVDLSPDGNYIVFQPKASDAPLAVWDVENNGFATYPLSSEEASYFPQSRPNWLQRQKIDWISADQFIVRIFDLDHVFHSLLAQQTYRVMRDPLQIVQEDERSIPYLPLPFPENTEPTGRAYTLSPQGTYTQLQFDEVIRGSRETRIRHQIYDTSSIQLVADYQSTEQVGLGFTYWSPDESRMFLEYGTADRGPQIREVDVTAGFQTLPGFEEALLTFFGDDLYIRGIHPEFAPLHSHLLFTFGTSERIPHVATYNYESRKLTVVCISYQQGPVPIYQDLSYAIWGADERFIGYYDNGFIYLFDTVTGDRYTVDGIGYVGWVNTLTASSTQSTAT